MIAALRKLLPETLGGEHNNCWNVLFERTVGRWRIERNERDFVRLVSELRPSRILEIGVARSWGAERMVKAAGAMNGRKIEYYGFDLFDNLVDGYSYAYKPISKDEVHKKLEKLGVSKILLFKGDSHDILPRVVSTLPKMDLIYIDGDHSHDGTKSDWENIQPLMNGETVVVFDDCPSEGVRKLVDEITNHEKILISYHQVAVRRR